MVENPVLIQGGMGVGVSRWPLAQAVARAGAEVNRGVLPVISGTGLALALSVDIKRGDPNTLRVLHAFNPQFAQILVNKYWGNLRNPPKPEVLIPCWGVSENSQRIRRETAMETVMAAYVQVTLAKEGHEGPVGINLLEKTQLPNVCTILGAMIANVDYVCVGAGIPTQIAGILDNFANGDPATYKVNVTGTDRNDTVDITLDPRDFVAEGTILKRPQFILIASLDILPRKMKGEIDGTVLEDSDAGGHNAPPRSKMVGEDGQPIYTEKDRPDLAKIRDLRLPFWLAGGYASPQKLAEAQLSGATGVQVGSAFALCEESGWPPARKRQFISAILDGSFVVKTSPTVSPTGFPFQVVQAVDTLSEPSVYESRKPVCNVGHLVEVYRRPDGKLDTRCPAELYNAYIRKGGDPSKADRKVCICSGSAAAAGLGFATATGTEAPIYTLGKDTSFVQELAVSGTYTAADVVRYMFGKS